MQRDCARAVFVLVSILAIVAVLSNPALAELKNFGVYQDTNANGELDVGDTFLGGFMNWYTYDSSSSSYNYGDHYSAGNPIAEDPLDGFTDLTGAPWARSEEGNDDLSWLPISNPDLSDDDVLHLYMVWSWWDNNMPEGLNNDRDGFSLGMLANSFIRSRSDESYGGGLDLDIAIRNDGSSLPQVTLSDDFQDGANLNDGRPLAPRGKDNLSQELYWIPDPGGEPYTDYFEGRWRYTVSTADGGVIGGIHNGDYDVLIDPNDLVTSISGDGLVIRMDMQDYDELSKIIIYDFGYANGSYDPDNPVELEIPLGIDPDMTFFIASIPEVIPEPTALLSLLVMGAVIVLGKGRR